MYCTETKTSLGWWEVLHGIYLEKCNLRGEADINGETELITDRLSHLDAEWIRVVRELGDLNELNDLELSCSDTTFYEVLLNEYKNRLVALQGNMDSRKLYKRKWLAKQKSLNVSSRQMPRKLNNVKTIFWIMTPAN
jgi:hypothetical protein